MKGSRSFSNLHTATKHVLLVWLILAIDLSSSKALSFSKNHRPVQKRGTGVGQRRNDSFKHFNAKVLGVNSHIRQDENSIIHDKNSANVHMYPATSITQMNAVSAGGSSQPQSKIDKIRTTIQKNAFLLGMAAAVSFARLYPSLGVNGGILKPELFIGKFGVTCIFLLSGVSLDVSELREAITNVKLNTIVQLGSFLAWPFLVGVPLVGGIRKLAPNLLPKPLLDGLIILTCLPTTVNMAVLLTGRAKGNVASALANAVFGNLFGIFATPALLMHFFGTMIELPFLKMVMKLCNKVLLPVAVGQFLRLTPAKDFFMSNKKKFKSLQEMILIGLVWNAFCNAFTKGIGIEIRHGFILLFMLSTLHIGSLLFLFRLFSSKFLNLTKGDIIAATFTTSHKTLAAGLPLVNTIFEGNPNLAAYCAPIMFIHPLQLLIGSIYAEKFVSEDDGED